MRNTETTQTQLKGETMATKTELTEITVYWDEQDPQNIGWAYQACHIRDGENEVAESGSVSVDGSASLDDAVDEVCYQLGVDLDHNDFGDEHPVGPLVAHWSQID